MTIRHFLSLVGAMALVCSMGCASTGQVAEDGTDPQANLSTNTPYVYIPIEPIPYLNTVASTSEQKNKLLSQLPNERSRISLAKIEANGSIGYGVGTASAAGASYRFALDSIKYRVVPLKVETTGPDENVQDTKYAFLIVGIGTRLSIAFDTKKGKFNLSSLFAISAAAEAEKIVGTIDAQTIGYSSQTASSLIPLPDELSYARTNDYLRSLAVIKGLVYQTDNEKLTIQPQILALDPRGIDLDIILDYLYKDFDPQTDFDKPELKVNVSVTQ